MDEEGITIKGLQEEPRRHQANTRLGRESPKPTYAGELYCSTCKAIKPTVDFKPYNIPDNKNKWEPTQRYAACRPPPVIQKAANPHTTGVVGTLKITRKRKVVESRKVVENHQVRTAQIQQKATKKTKTIVRKSQKSVASQAREELDRLFASDKST